MATLVVIGGAMSGLATALFAARRGHSVLLIERDLPPADDGAAADCGTWRRPGVPHARQGHLFLGRSSQILREDAPDVLAALLEAGAVAVPIGGAGGPQAILARRLFYEGVLRRAVERERSVTVLDGSRAVGLDVRRRTDGFPIVTGVRTSSGDRLPGDVVVDATGSVAVTRRWLHALGIAVAQVAGYDCGFRYVCRQYRLKHGCVFPDVSIPLVASLPYATVVVFPADNQTFSLSIVTSNRDPCSLRLRHGGTFDRVVGAIPFSAAWLERGEPLDDPQTMAGLRNRRYSLVCPDRPVVGGLVLVGDAAVQLSPALGRGVSMAFAQAQQLTRLLDDGYAVDLAPRLEEWTSRHLGVWLDTQIAEDRASDERYAAALRSETWRPADDLAHRIVIALATLRDDDRAVHTASDLVFNMMITPRELLRDPHVRRRIHAFLARYPANEPLSDGPTRREFERLAA